MSKDLLNKILITLGFILLYRVLAYVPVPGVNIDVVKEFFDTNSNNALGMMNMFSGNAVKRVSIISLGIMPYITASIIMELLAATFSSLGKMKKEKDGMTKYMQIIRYATVVITFIQAIGVSMGLNSLTGGSGQSAITIDMDTFIAVAAISMVAGTIMLVWIGEQITQKGIGNGISLIIFAGIVSAIPSAIGGTVDLVNNGQLSFLTVIAMLVVILATVGFIIYVELGERRVPVSYSRKVMMQNQNKRVMNYIPIKLNLSGVIPVIFASAILMFPGTILQGSQNEYLVMIGDFLNPASYSFKLIMFLFVIFFAYFYASITFNAKEIAENLKRQGGFIPGVRPGGSTSEFLNETASRLTLFGSIYLGFISTVPLLVVQAMGVPFYFGGVAVLIVVQVAIDTMRKIEAQQYMNKYDTISAVGL
jgi:preprotein translocase subunit SecY